MANRYLYGDVVDEVLVDEQFANGSGPAVNSGTASTSAGETLWTIADHLGSIRDVVDNSGVVRQHVIYGRAKGSNLFVWSENATITQS